ncbi:MAG: 4Fe-4S binding protein [Thermoplasmata archaeon]|nr:4Fe-4S binding protein [Thermoplasmata archaeon]
MATVKILKFYPEKCDGSRECEKACSNVHFKNDKGGEWSAITIVKGAQGYDMEVCNHCGLCIDMCPVQALKRLNSGIVVLSKKTCIGCQACVGFCPQGVMMRAPEVITPFKCISCGKCVEACPNGALELVEVELDDIEEVVYHKQGVCE